MLHGRAAGVGDPQGRRATRCRRTCRRRSACAAAFDDTPRVGGAASTRSSRRPGRTATRPCACTRGRSSRNTSAGADWPFLREVKRRYPDRTILGSGDVFTAEDAVRMLRETGVDIVWIARGAIGNPWIFAARAAAARATRTRCIAAADDPRAARRAGRAFRIAMQIHGEQLAGPAHAEDGDQVQRFHPEASAWRFLEAQDVRRAVGPVDDGFHELPLEISRYCGARVTAGDTAGRRARSAVGQDGARSPPVAAASSRRLLAHQSDGLMSATKFHGCATASLSPTNGCTRGCLPAASRQSGRRRRSARSWPSSHRARAGGLLPALSRGSKSSLQSYEVQLLRGHVSDAHRDTQIGTSGSPHQHTTWVVSEPLCDRTWLNWRQRQE